MLHYRKTIYVILEIDMKRLAGYDMAMMVSLLLTFASVAALVASPGAHTSPSLSLGELA